MSITATALILAIFFAFGLPPILKNVLESQILKNFNRHSSIESVSFNPFKLSLTVENLSILEQKSDTLFVSLEKLRINAEIISLFKGGIALNEVSHVKPSVHIPRTKTYTYVPSHRAPFPVTSFKSLLKLFSKVPGPILNNSAHQSP